MTLRLDVARRRDVLARWCALAEQRLEFLTELFESGRWRRYHSELSFLENIQEAKAAVQLWRDLSRRESGQEAAPVASAAGITWPAPTRATVPVQSDKLRDGVLHVQAPRLAAAPPPELARAAEAISRSDGMSSERAAVAPEAAAPPRVVELTLELDGIQARYPLLRNAF